MKNPNLATSPPSPDSTAQSKWAAVWSALKNKRISYFTIPLLVMATVTEFVILATGWKYQQAVCLPLGMGVTFFGIGPIGATILAVELLKLPLAIWTASRQGWQRGFMLFAGLPLICLLTFQLVKDMAVYEMGTAMAPAGQFLEKAAAEEIKIKHLEGELAAIEQKKTDREQKLAELAQRKAKAKTDLDEALRHNQESRTDAVTLTDYQKKELSEVEIRQAAIIKQFDADTEQLTKSITDLRARRETEVGRATKWNAEEARLENDYKAKLSDYTNRKAAYEKDKAEYDSANFLKRSMMKEPVDTWGTPQREANTILKPTLVADLDAQIKAKEAELIAVANKRRDRIAQVDTDARHVREEFDRRSSTRREETDRKREELLAAHTALVVQLGAEEKQIDQEFQTAAHKVDGIRQEADASRKQAEKFYEARENALKNTQVHRIATTVEIVRGLLMGERPVSITATARERGDLYTDQISMVRIWVYPVLAFIVAFLPTLMVEIGFSTLFTPEQQQPPHRLGFLGRRMHWLYTRAGRLKILRAERIANEASTEIAARDAALADAHALNERILSDKEAELQATRNAMGSAAAQHEEELKSQENEWVAKLAGMADSLNRTVIEKDALKDLQKSEIERQVQMRQNAWSERVTQLRQELDDQRSAAETERMALIQEHHTKLMEVSENSKTQVFQARRQMADAELASVEKSARLEHDLKEALHARDEAVAQSRQQSESFSLKLSQTGEDAAREIEKIARQEKHRLDLQQMEFAKSLRQREEDFGRQLKQREQEIALTYETRIAEETNKLEQESRRREGELQRQFELRAVTVDARWKQEVQQREDATETRLKQQEQQLQAQAEARISDLQAKAEQELRRQKLEFERQFETQSREGIARMREELQQIELSFHGKLKQREQELVSKAASRETELQTQWTSDLRNRQEEWEREATSRAMATETRLGHEAQQKEEVFQSKLRQRDQQWQAKLDALRAELQAQSEQAVRRRDVEAETALRELEGTFRKEMLQKEEVAKSEAKQREHSFIAQWSAQADARLTAAEEQWQKESEKRISAAVSPLKAELVRAEQERDEAKESAAEALSHVQVLERKLNEASSFLNGWKNGKHLVAVGRS